MASENSVLHTYNRLPITFRNGDGVWLYDNNGNKFLDLLAGVAVNTVGHSHSYFISGLKEQLDQVIHVSNYVNIQHQDLLAKRLASSTGMDAVFFSNSCLLYTSPSPRDRQKSRMPSSA